MNRIKLHSPATAAHVSNLNKMLCKELITKKTSIFENQQELQS